MYVQASVLDEAAIHPDSSWWLKADGVNMLPGLGVYENGVEWRC